MNRVCSIDGCEKPSKARGLCGRHYERLRNHGDPLAGGPICYTPEDRFDNSWKWSDGVIGEGVDTPCMLWTAATTGEGYGKLRVDGRTTLAHRYSYQRFAGEIPDGLLIDRLCRVRNCVNPDHLEPVTSILRGLAAVNSAKTRCPRGHELIEGNLVESDKVRGMRVCLTCQLERGRRQAALIGAAHKALGLSKREYTAKYGYSAKVAEKVLREVAK